MAYDGIILGRACQVVRYGRCVGGILIYSLLYKDL